MRAPPPGRCAHPDKTVPRSPGLREGKARFARLDPLNVLPISRNLGIEFGAVVVVVGERCIHVTERELELVGDALGTAAGPGQEPCHIGDPNAGASNAWAATHYVRRHDDVAGDDIYNTVGCHAIESTTRNSSPGSDSWGWIDGRLAQRNQHVLAALPPPLPLEAWKVGAVWAKPRRIGW
jgi:hypothetical protein